LAEDNEFSRNVSGIGHWGTGNFEVNVRTMADLEKTKELIVQSYERS
jgi:predicted transport protein